MAKINYYIPGIILIFMGVLIFIAPQILVAFVSALFLISGLGFLYAGHRIRKSKAEWRDALYSKARVQVFSTPFDEHLAYWN